MVATLLYAAGFKVIDLGINVKGDDFLKAVKEENADVLAMSALLNHYGNGTEKSDPGIKRCRTSG